MEQNHPRIPREQIINEMIHRQLPNIPEDRKLLFDDMQRIGKFVNQSMFDENTCAVWNGYITNEQNEAKGTYINFYFNKKKMALHRILYVNFVGEIGKNEYIRYTCENRGKCCNVTHMKKHAYLNKKGVEEDVVDDEPVKPTTPKPKKKMQIEI
jgi:hypothetical protein